MDIALADTAILDIDDHVVVVGRPAVDGQGGELLLRTGGANGAYCESHFVCLLLVDTKEREETSVNAVLGSPQGLRLYMPSLTRRPEKHDSPEVTPWPDMPWASQRDS